MSLSRKPLHPWKGKKARRVWDDANEQKRGPCRVCWMWPVELAHTVSREKQDEPRIGPRGGKVWYVPPEAVVPLCRTHHQAYDAHKLDLLSYLTLEEELAAVSAAGGIARAYRRLTGVRDA